MYNQIITPHELATCIKRTELRNLRDSREELEAQVAACVGDSLYDGTYTFKIEEYDGLFLNSHINGSIEALSQDLLLRKIYRNITRIYSVSTENRNRIIAQVRTLLNEPEDLFVLRLDIHHFYESINRDSLMQRLRANGRLSVQTLDLLDSLFFIPCFKNYTGLPKGLNISAALSECYMKYFDIAVRKMDGVFYYARYVDDIIVFCISKQVMCDVYEFIKKELAQLTLELNEKKTILWESSSSKPLTYLGYKFTKVSKSVKITIADEKIKKIKTRITRSFVRFSKDYCYEDLVNRVKYLTGNFCLNNGDRLIPIMVGIYYNYRFINDVCALNELQLYFNHILHCQMGKLGLKLEGHLTSDQRRRLARYNFIFGFNKRVRHNFTKENLMKIKNCWR